MPHIDRPVKAGGSRQFQTEVAAGFIDILSQEVDGDIDTIYALCNGNLANDNIASTAAIAYSKLALAGSIKGSDMAAGANIPGTALAAGSVPASAIVPNSITDTQLTDGAFITNKSNFLVGASTWEQEFANNDADFTLAPAAETIMAQTAWTPRAAQGFWLAMGRVSGYLGASNGQHSTLAVRLRYGGSAGVADGTILDKAEDLHAFGAAGTSALVPFSVTLVAMGSFAAGGTYLKLTATNTLVAGSPASVILTNCRVQVWEPA
jgi:hypothetical protein